MATGTNYYEYATTVSIRDLICRLDPGRCLTGSTDFDVDGVYKRDVNYYYYRHTQQRIDGHNGRIRFPKT